MAIVTHRQRPWGMANDGLTRWRVNIFRMLSICLMDVTPLSWWYLRNIILVNVNGVLLMFSSAASVRSDATGVRDGVLVSPEPVWISLPIVVVSLSSRVKCAVLLYSIRHNPLDCSVRVSHLTSGQFLGTSLHTARYMYAHITYGTSAHKCMHAYCIHTYLPNTYLLST